MSVRTDPHIHVHVPIRTVARSCARRRPRPQSLIRTEAGFSCPCRLAVVPAPPSAVQGPIPPGPRGKPAASIAGALGIDLPLRHRPLRWLHGQDGHAGPAANRARARSAGMGVPISQPATPCQRFRRGKPRQCAAPVAFASSPPRAATPAMGHYGRAPSVRDVHGWHSMLGHAANGMARGMPWDLGRTSPTATWRRRRARIRGRGTGRRKKKEMEWYLLRMALPSTGRRQVLRLVWLFSRFVAAPRHVPPPPAVFLAHLSPTEPTPPSLFALPERL